MLNAAYRQSPNISPYSPTIFCGLWLEARDELQTKKIPALLAGKISHLFGALHLKASGL
jgi:hypothetical protein